MATEKLNIKLLYERLNKFENLVKLVRYIYRVQGTSLRRLNFEEAAKELNVDRKSVSRYCDQLARCNVIRFEGDSLQLAVDIIKVS